MQQSSHSHRGQRGRGAFASGSRQFSKYCRGGRVLALPTTVESVDMIELLRAESRCAQSESCESQQSTAYARAKRQRTGAPTYRPAMHRETDRQSEQEEESRSHEETLYAPIEYRRDYDISLSESRCQQDALFLDAGLPLHFDAHSTRTHRSLAFFTDVDRDLRCVIDALLHYSSKYYEQLKRDAFLNASIYEEIAQSNSHDIAYVGDLKMRLALVVIQHLCARLRNRKLKQDLVNGMVVLYHYYFFYVQGRSEEKIVEVLRDAGRFNVEELCDDNDEDIDFLTTLSIVQPELQKPRYKILAPWTQCLDLMRKKQVFVLHGYAHLNYTQVADWTVQRWTSGFEQWIQHDLKIVVPLMNRHLDNISSELSNVQLKAERTKMRRDFELILMRDHFYLEPSLGADFDARRFLHPIYAQLFAHVRSNLDVRASSSSQSSSVLDTNYPQFHDYIEVMPPCVMSLYLNAMKTRSHFKYNERFFFFTWAYKVGMSLGLLEDMWTKMCEQDEQAVRQGKLASLSIEPSTTYARHDESPTQVNLHRCETLQKMHHCSFVEDIEDLAQQRSCIAVTCGTSSSWHQHVDTWSPMAATRFKVKQKK